jgi:hypothetical protein
MDQDVYTDFSYDSIAITFIILATRYTTSKTSNKIFHFEPPFNLNFNSFAQVLSPQV